MADPLARTLRAMLDAHDAAYRHAEQQRAEHQEAANAWLREEVRPAFIRREAVFRATDRGLEVLPHPEEPPTWWDSADEDQRAAAVLKVAVTRDRTTEFRYVLIVTGVATGIHVRKEISDPADTHATAPLVERQLDRHVLGKIDLAQWTGDAVFEDFMNDYARRLATLVP